LVGALPTAPVIVPTAVAIASPSQIPVITPNLAPILADFSQIVANFCPLSLNFGAACASPIKPAQIGAIPIQFRLIAPQLGSIPLQFTPGIMIPPPGGFVPCFFVPRPARIIVRICRKCTDRTDYRKHTGSSQSNQGFAVHENVLPGALDGVVHKTLQPVFPFGPTRVPFENAVSRAAPRAAAIDRRFAWQ